MSPANIAMHDYQESVTTGQTDTCTEGQIDAGQSDRYVPLCFASDTKTRVVYFVSLYHVHVYMYITIVHCFVVLLVKT